MKVSHETRRRRRKTNIKHHALFHIEQFHTSLMFDDPERLRKNVGGIIVTGSMHQLDSTFGDLIAKMMYLNVNVFGFRKINWILSDIEGGQIGRAHV